MKKWSVDTGSQLIIVEMFLEHWTEEQAFSQTGRNAGKENNIFGSYGVVNDYG